MKDTKTVRLSIIILLGGAAILAVYLGIVLPRERTRVKYHKAIVTLNRFNRMAYEIKCYERDNDTWPSRLETVMPAVYPEYLSDPKGNSTVHLSFNGTGGWVYNAEERRFCVNVEGTVGEILGIPGDGDLINSTPSEWRWSEEEKEASSDEPAPSDRE